MSWWRIFAHAGTFQGTFFRDLPKGYEIAASRCWSVTEKRGDSSHLRFLQITSVSEIGEKLLNNFSKIDFCILCQFPIDFWEMQTPSFSGTDFLTEILVSMTSGNTQHCPKVAGKWTRNHELLLLSVLFRHSHELGHEKEVPNDWQMPTGENSTSVAVSCTGKVLPRGLCTSATLYMYSRESHITNSPPKRPMCLSFCKKIICLSHEVDFHRILINFIILKLINEL